jgi:hypothetical protein
MWRQAGLRVRVALGWAKMALVASQNPREKMDREFQVLAESVHVDALAKAERALFDAGIQLLNVSDYGQDYGKTRDSLDGREEGSKSKVDVEM